MNKKLILRYVLLCLPFIFGIALYSLSIFNIISSILFFCGGYIAIKNLCDYRKINKNIRLVNRMGTKDCYVNNNKDNVFVEIEKVMDSSNNIYRNCDDIPGFKRVRRYTKVRRRY